MRSKRRSRRSRLTSALPATSRRLDPRSRRSRAALARPRPPRRKTAGTSRPRRARTRSARRLSRRIPCSMGLLTPPFSAIVTPDDMGRTMTFIAKKTLPRRTFLRAAGATVALPMLDAMLPAFGADAAPWTPRLGFMYVGNGIVHKTFKPERQGADFELSPVLAPLATLRKQ